MMHNTIMPLLTTRQYPCRPVWVALVIGLACLACPERSPAAETVPVIVDHYTGYAMNGYDPVTYFMSAQPQKGVDGFEARWGGVSWRFVNAGNRKAFLISPLVYMPQFGGYDPVALGRGVMTGGDPQLYLLYKDKLYFFFSPYTREDFQNDAARTLRAAQQNWPRLKDGRD